MLTNDDFVEKETIIVGSKGEFLTDVAWFKGMGASQDVIAVSNQSKNGIIIYKKKEDRWVKG